MAKKLNVELEITANAKQAKQTMVDLQKKLNDIIITRTINVDDKSINDAKQAAIDLKHHLEEATDVKTGKLNLSKFSSSLKKSGQNLQGLYNKITQIGPAGQGAFLSLAQSVAKADTASINLKSKLGGLLITLKNTAKWQISSSILHGFMGAVQSAYGYAEDLNKSLNNIRIVTGQNIDQMSKFAIEANKAAKALSTSTTAYTDAALIYYQQGLNDEEVKERTDATIKLANVSRQSAEEVSSQMTAIWNNFKTEGKTVEYYADVITALGATTASSSSEIAEGLSKFASVADTVGLSYEKASAALATVVAETRQSADIVGTAFKTMFARIEGLKQGETLEDGVGLNKYSEALQKVGVNVLDSNNQLKQMDTILDELGQKWNSIDQTQKVALAQTVAGVRQYTQFVSLMDNYDKVQKNEGVAASSEGTVQKQADIYAESWEAASKRVNAALQDIYNQLINDEAFISMLNGIESFVSMIGNVIKGLGGIKGILLTVSSIFMQYYAKEMPAFLQKTIQDLRILSGVAERNRVSTLSGLDEIIQKMTALDSSKFLSGQLTGMQTLSKMYLELAQKKRFLSSTEVEAYEQKIKEIEAYKMAAEAIGKEVDEIKKEQNQRKNQVINQLRESGFSNTQNLNKLEDQEQQEAIKYLIPEINKDSIDKTKKEIEKAQEEINKAKQQKNKADDELQTAYGEVDNAFYKYGFKTEQYNEAETNFNKKSEEQKEAQNKVKELEGYLEQLNNKLNKVENSFSGKDLLKGLEDSAQKFHKIEIAIEATSKKTTAWKRRLEEIGENDSIENITKEMQDYVKKLQEAGVEVGDLDNKIKKLSHNPNDEQALKDVQEGFKQALSVETEGNNYDKMKNKVNDYREALISLGVEEHVLDELIEKFKQGELTEEQFTAALKKLEEQQNTNLTHTVKLSEGLMQFASVCTQVVSVVNTFRNLGSIWENEDLSTGEKVLQTLSAIGTIIPSLISLYKIFNTVVAIGDKISLKSAASSVADAAGKAAEATSTEGATVAQLGFNAAMEANPIIALITLIAGLIAIVAVLTVSLIATTKAETEEQKALKKANKELENAKKAAEEAQQAYENLKNKISSYKSAIETLKECTKGTQEWRDAFKEVLQQAEELINTFPQLLTYKNLFNSDGTLNVDVLKQVQDQAEAGSTALGMQTVRKSVNQQKAEYDLNKSLTSTELQANIRKNEQYEKMSAEAQTAIPKVIDDLLNQAGSIDFNDSDQVKKIIEENVKSLYSNLEPERFETVVNQLSESIKDITNDLNKFSVETENVTTAMKSGTNMLLQTVFNGDIPEGKLLEYQQAMQEKSQELVEKYGLTDQNGKWSGAAYNYVNNHTDNGNYDDVEKMKTEEGGKQLLKTLNEYTKMTPNLSIDEEDVYGKEDGEWYFYFKDQNGKREKKKFTEVQSSVRDALLLSAKDEIIENAKSNKTYAGLDSATRSFLTNENYLGASIQDLEWLSQNKESAFKNAVTKSGLNLKDENGEWNDQAVKQFLIEQGISEDTIDDARIKNWENNAVNGIDNVLKQLEELPKGFQEIIKENNSLQKLNIEQAKAFSSTYSTMVKNVGVEGAQKIITDLAESSAGEFNKIVEAIKNEDINFENMNIDEANDQLKKLGISFKFTNQQFYTFRSAIQELGFITAEAAKETVKTISSILSKIKQQGDIVEDKDYQNLLKLNPAIDSFFTTLADGTHMLTGEVQDFKTMMQTATIDQLNQAMQHQKEIALGFSDLRKINKVSAESLKKEGPIVSSMWDGKATSYMYDKTDRDLYDKYYNQVQASIKALEGSTNEQDQQLAAQLNKQIEREENLNKVAVQAIEAVEKLGLSEEELAKKEKIASEEANKLKEAIKETQYQFSLQNAGLDYEVTENYADTLMDLYEAEGLTKDGARGLAIANQRLDRGLSSLNDNFKTWTDSLKNTNKASAEYAKTIGEIRNAFADLLNIADAEELSLGWIEKWTNNAEKMKKILNGDTEAIQEFRESAFTEMTTNVFSDMEDSVEKLQKELKNAGENIPDWLTDINNKLKEGKFDAENLRSAIQDIDGQAIGGKATLSDEYTKALNEMLAQGLLTEQQLNDIFATIGYKPKVTTDMVEQTVFVPEYETTELVADKVDGHMEDGVHWSKTVRRSKTVQKGGTYMTQKIPVAQIESADSATGNIEIVNAGSSNITPSYSSTTSGKSSDSSKKDSSSNPTTKAASHEHEVNRYSNEENAIKGLSEQYDRLNKVKDKAFGKSRIQTIEAEIKHLKALKEASGDYLDAIVGKGNADKMAKAIFKGENIGQIIANGSLGGTARADYNSLFGGLSASGKGVEYSAKDANGNEWLVSDNYSLSGFNSLFGTNLQFNLDSYGNIQNKDAIYNLLQNLKNNENDAYSRVADPTAGSTTEYNKRMAYLEAIKERVDQFEETVDLMGEKADEYIDYIASIQEKNAELITTKMEHGVNLGQKTIQRLERAIKVLGDNIYKTVEAMTSWYNATLKDGVAANKQQGEAYAQALEETAEKIRLYDQKDGYFNEDAIDPASAAELFSSIEDGYDSLIDDLLNRIEEGKAYYGNVLDYWNNKLDKVNSAIQTNAQLLEHFQTVLNLLGRSADYEAIGIILQGQLDNAQDDYISKKAQADVAKQAYERAVQDREKIISQGISDEALEEYDKNVLQIAFQNYQTKADAMYQSLEAYIEAANAKFENESSRLFAESENRLTGEWGSFDALDNAMQRQRAVSDEYLTKTNQLYESNTLLRKLSQDIDKTDSRIAKEKLKAFSDEIEAMKVQEKLSKTDLEIAKARYELLQAEIALEEARNAKSTVRLQRDNEGNYGYVYTADQDAINDAEQNLADKQNNLYNLVLSQTQEYGEKMIQLRKEHDAEIQALEDAYYKENIISREEFEMQLQDIEKKYRELEYTEKESYETAKLWLNQVGAEGQTEAWTNSFDEIITQHRLFNDESEDNITELSNNIMNNLNELDSYRESITEEAKMGNEELTSSVNEIARSTDELSKKVAGKNGLADSMNTAMITAQNLATVFSNQYDELNKLVQGYADAADRANELYLKTVNLTNAQIALNQAQAGATEVYGIGSASAYSNNDNNNGNNNGNNGPSIKANANNTTNSNKTTRERYSRVEQIGTGYWFYAPESSAEQYRKYPNRWKVTNLKSGGYVGVWTSAKTGMYTGSWNGPDIEENGKLAFLHQKELVLNADDTKNMLSAVKLIRQISQSIDLQALSQAQGLSAQAAQFSTEGQTLQQEVTIHAEFPNVSDHNEIEEALSNLVNRAAQFASRY